MTSLRVGGWLRWKTLILPAIFPVLRHRRDHRRGRRVERLDRRRGRHLRPPPPDRAPASAPTSPRRPRPGTSPHDPGRRGRDERLRRPAQPALLAPAVPPGRTAVLAVTRHGPKTGAVHRRGRVRDQDVPHPGRRALPVLDGIDFSSAEGEIVALLGKSGSGKSTLLRCVAGLIAPSTGHGRLPGHAAQRRQPRRGHGLPDLRAAALADGAAERRARPAGPRRRDERAGASGRWRRST